NVTGSSGYPAAERKARGAESILECAHWQRRADSRIRWVQRERSNPARKVIPRGSAMKKLVLMMLFAGLVLDVAASTQGQSDSGNRFVVNFTDPSRPGLLKVNLFNNGITVRSYNGKEIIIETTSRRGRRGRPDTTPDGLRRIDTNVAGLTVEEENNVMSINARSPNDSGDLDIQVPVKTNLNLRTVNGGNITVEGVEGEIEVSNTNGGVMLNNVAGSVVVPTTNGRKVASFRGITPNKPMSRIMPKA